MHRASDGPSGGYAAGVERPRILLTTSTEFRDRGLRREDTLTGQNYSEAVALAGGLPLLAANLEPGLVHAFLEGIDGVLFTGGADIDPEYFGRQPEPRLGKVDRRRDEFELALYRAARERSLPVLGVCRGIQVINVAEGGTLHQHLPDLPEMIQHDQVDIGGAPSHAVSLEQECFLARELGRTALRTNSHHHQGIEHLGENLRVVGRTGDGLIEAIEASAGAPLLAVQWHPEMSFRDHPDQLLPFEFLVGAALGPRASSSERADARPARS